MAGTAQHLMFGGEFGGNYPTMDETEAVLSRDQTMMSKAASNLSLANLRPMSPRRRQLLLEMEEELARERDKQNDPGGTPGVDEFPVIQEEEEDCDTDLDDDDHSATPFDQWGVATYEESCKKLNLEPIRCVGRHLKTMDLIVKHRILGPREALAIANALTVNTTVTSLNLDGNNLQDKSMKYLALMLTENLNIRMLSLAENSLGTQSAREIAEMMSSNTSLIKLNLSGNNFGDSDVEELCKILLRNRTLQELDLSHNHFGDFGATMFGPAIGANESLRDLNLSWNKFRPGGGIDICRGLEDNVVLNKLNLAMNGLSTEGAIAMANALKHNDSLREVDISQNRIYDEAVAKMCKTLETNETLKVLKIGHNPLTTIGAIGLCTAIKRNEASAIILLDMSGIHVHKDFIVIAQDLAQIRSRFNYKVGGILRSDRYYGDDKDKRAKNLVIGAGPLAILRWFINSNGLRMVDIFTQLDKDGSMSVTKNEFISGLKTFNVPLTASQMEELVKSLDKDGDGEVDFKELLEWEKDERRKARSNKTN